ncbi:MAG: hypothetical protein PUC06_10740 [Oscillospiraceae bacterium]|nr:hypothetical protein [Oscillospiraceae bacterium]
MPKDESRFDTQKLLEGVEASDLYSFEDVWREFSDQPLPGEGERQECAPEPKSEVPAEAEPVSETQWEIADAIAQAVESSLQQEDRIAAVAGEPVIEPDAEMIRNQPLTDADPQPELSTQPPEEPGESEPEDQLEEEQPPRNKTRKERRKEKKAAAAKGRKGLRSPTDTVEKRAATRRPASQEPPEETNPMGQEPEDESAQVLPPQSRKSEKPQKPAAQRKSTGQRPEEKAEAQDAPDAPAFPERPAPMKKKPANSSEKQPVKEQPQEKEPPVRNPGTGHAVIPQSKISVGILESLGLMFSDLHRRQQTALPPATASLRATEKRRSRSVQLSRMTGPVRGIIALLMIFAIGGRSFPWMLLGFLGGEKGITIAVVLTIVAMGAAFPSVIRGFRDVIYLRMSYETLLILVTVLTVVEAIATKNTSTMLPLVALSWCVSGQADLLSGQASLRTLRAVITGRSRVGIRSVRNLWEHTDAVGKAPAGTAGFVRRLYEPDVWHRGYTIFFLPFLFLVLVMSAYLTAKTRGSFLSILVQLLNVGLPVGLVLCCARPFGLLSEVLTGRGAVAGWYGMREMSGRKNVLIYDSDLFPKEAIGHKGVRLYGKENLQTVVSFAGSLVIHGNVGLTEVFARLMREVNGSMCDIQHFQAMEGGIQGTIYGNNVMVGSYQFMQLMGISLPRKAPKSGVFVAINGNMSAVVAIRYGLHRGAVSGMHRLVREPRLTPMLVTRSFSVNPAYVEKWFKAPVSQQACPKYEVRRKLSEPSVLKKGVTCGFVLREGVSVYSRVVAGARRVYRTGLWATVSSVLLTTVLTVRTAMALSAGTPLISCQRLLVIHLILLAVIEVFSRLAIRK